MPDAPLKTAEEQAREYDQLLLKQSESVRQQATDRVNKGIKTAKVKKSKGKRAKNRRK